MNGCAEINTWPAEMLRLQDSAPSDMQVLVYLSVGCHYSHLVTREGLHARA